MELTLNFKNVVSDGFTSLSSCSVKDDVNVCPTKQTD